LKAKKTILIVIEHYLPGTRAGGPVRSISNLVEALGDTFDFCILTCDHDNDETETYPGIEAGVWYPVGKAQVRYLNARERQLFALGDIIRRTPHDLLLVESILERMSIFALVLRRLGRLGRVPILITPRGHLGAGALAQKFAKKASFLAVVRPLGLYNGLHWYATSEAEREDIVREFGPGEAPRIRVIPNLPSHATVAGYIVRPPKCAGALRVVFVSRISRKKNLHFALDSLRRLHGNVEFDIYGPIEDAHYWAECQSIIATLPTHIRVQYRGFVPFDQTIAVISGYHLFYLPTLHENYGHVIAEALSAGCPVLISDQTPWNEIEQFGAGWALALEDRMSFTRVLNQVCAMDESDFSAQLERVADYMRQHTAKSETAALFSALFKELIMHQGL